MHTTEKTTTQKTKDDPAHDLGQMGAKRKYRGKYPDRIKTVASKDSCRAYDIVTNAGASFEFRVLHRHANSPQCGQDIQDWLFFVTPQNDEAYDVVIREGVEL